MIFRLASILFLLIVVTCAHAQRGYPTIERGTQKARDDDRQMILRSELQDEREALAKAQAMLIVNPSKDVEAELHRRSENVNALLRELGLAGKSSKPSPVAESEHAVVRVAPSRAEATRKPVAAAARFWNPYNRAANTTAFSTRPGRDTP